MAEGERFNVALESQEFGRADGEFNLHIVFFELRSRAFLHAQR